jgi:cob(I)alamin adenosyltransferase
MSIVTRKGDAGTTGLMYNRRISKCDPRVEAYGTVDELSAALGLARATGREAAWRERIESIQHDLIALMGELATHPDDLDRYTREGYARLTPAAVQRLDQWVHEVESAQPAAAGWATPGHSLDAAALDLARAVCRRAERRICELSAAGQFANADIVAYLNRLSDLLWLCARRAERG